MRHIKNNIFARGPKNLFFIVFIFLLSIIVLTRLTDHTRNVRIFTYSQFLDAIDKNEVNQEYTRLKNILIVGRS